MSCEFFSLKSGVRDKWASMGPLCEYHMRSACSARCQISPHGVAPGNILECNEKTTEKPAVLAKSRIRNGNASQLSVNHRVSYMLSSWPVKVLCLH